MRSFAFQNVGVGRCVCHFSSSSKRILASSIDSGGRGRRPSQIASVATRVRSRGPRRGFDDEEVAGGSEGPHASLLRQAPWPLQMCCRRLLAGSLIMNYNVLFSLKGWAPRYPPGPLPEKPLQIESVGRGCRPLQIESVAMRFRCRGPRAGFNNEEVASAAEGLCDSSLRQALWLLRM